MTATEAVAASAVPDWRGGFGRLWTAAIVSRFGDSLRTAALPLLAASLTDDPLLIASVTACGFLPWLLFGLLGGAIADRVDQRRAMWAVDLVRGALMAAFAVAVALGHATVALLLVLAFALTTLQTLFDNAATALLPALVPTEALAAANARLMTGQQFAGGLLAAPLVPALLLAGDAVPYVADAATYVLAALLIASLRTGAPERPPRPAGSTLRKEMAEGLATLRRDRPLRWLCTATTLCNIGMGALIATLVVHVTDGRQAGNAGNAAYAATITAYAVGGVMRRPPRPPHRRADRTHTRRRPRRDGPDGLPGPDGRRPRPRGIDRGHGGVRSHGDGVERQPDDPHAGARPRRDARPHLRGLPHPRRRGRSARGPPRRRRGQPAGDRTHPPSSRRHCSRSP